MAGAPNQAQIFTILDRAVKMRAGGNESAEAAFLSPYEQAGFAAELKDGTPIWRKIGDFTDQDIGNGGFRLFGRDHIAGYGVNNCGEVGCDRAFENVVQEFLPADRFG